jgi:hypothetical protein
MPHITVTRCLLYNPVYSPAEIQAAEVAASKQYEVEHDFAIYEQIEREQDMMVAAVWIDFDDGGTSTIRYV